MLQLLQPMASLGIGIALSVYGLVQTVLHRPDSAVFQRFIEHLPVMLTVSIFLFGLLAVLVGLMLLVQGWRSLRERITRLNRFYGVPSRYDDEDPYEPRYHH